MHCLRSHLSASHCRLMTGSAGSIFSGFRLVLRRAVNLPEPAAGGIVLPLPPLVREPGGEDKDGEGLKKGEKIDFAFEWVAVRQRKAMLPTSPPFSPPWKKGKINLWCRFKRPQTDIRMMKTCIFFLTKLDQNCFFHMRHVYISVSTWGLLIYLKKAGHIAKISGKEVWLSFLALYLKHSPP